ncbi:WD40 repeat domain-containing protein [Phanerochaete sordida]|uniref:WD40 repeat domain-containing protein n=1 Tax=Phanerochaete sordida TaxID=48140 RepID=A0A9P3L8Y2_9APHY|nr:WD40 repeat domain-containing protein [Phanerochaete sordida]
MPPSRRDHSSIYAQALTTTLSHGYPLWWPEPLETGEIQIGDVGYIDENGVFVRLFNTVDPQPIPNRHVQFEPVPLPAMRSSPAEHHNAMVPARYSSRGVEETSVKASVQADAAPGAADLQLEYTCKEEQGAMLVLKSPAKELSLPNTKGLRTYVSTQFPRWQRFLTEDLDLVDDYLKRMYFVRGWLKTTADWTVTAFVSSGAKWKIGAHAGVGVGGSAGLDYAQATMRTGPVVSRWGHKFLPQTSAVDDQKVDQCIFIKYYAVKPRGWFLPPKLEAGAGPASLPDRPGEDADQTVLVSDDDSNELQHDAPGLPIDALLDYILENSEADVALACDEDLLNLVQGSGEEWPRDMSQFLQRVRPPISIDEQKCGSIPLYESIRHRRQFMSFGHSPQNADEGFTLTDHTSQAGRTVDGQVLLGPGATSYDWPHLQFAHKNVENGSITSAVVSPNGKWLAAAFDDVAVTVWRLCDGRVLQNLDENGHIDTIWTVAWAPDSTTLASGSADHDVLVWDVAPGRIVHRLTAHTADVTALAYSPDGATLASGGADAAVLLWNAATGTLIATLAGHGIGITRVLFASDGARLAACTDAAVTLWDPRTHTRVAELRGHTSAVWAAAFAPQGDRLVTGSEDASARVWSAEDGAELATIHGHTGAVWAVAFAPAGDEIASASFDGSVVVSDSWTAERKHVFGEGQTTQVEAVAYSKGGHLVAAGSSDGHVRVWDAKSGEAVVEFRGHEEKVKKVVFTPDEKELVSVAEDGTIRAWGLLDTLCLL